MSVVTVMWPEADWSFYSTLRRQSITHKSVLWEISPEVFSRSVKLTVELPQHADNKLPQRLGKRSAEKRAKF